MAEKLALMSLGLLDPGLRLPFCMCQKDKCLSA